jgi:peptide deformylase
MYQDLQIIHYPDPRLKAVSKKIEVFDDALKSLVQRMFVLMREAEGVGLAAPQVGVNLRLFVMNHSGDPADDRVICNPVLTPLDDDDEEAEEGCLSIPGVRVNCIRAGRIKLLAQDITGQPFEAEGAELVARIWQHETDHLDGRLLTDRMGFTEKVRYKKKLKDLEAHFLAESKKRKVVSTQP